MLYSDIAREFESFVTATSANEPDNALERLERMKILLFILALVSLTLFPPSGGPGLESAQAALSVMRPVAQAATEAAAPAHPGSPALQVAAIGNDLRLGLDRTERASGSAGTPDAMSEGMPSTGTGLAALLLMMCILVGRRNRSEDM